MEPSIIKNDTCAYILFNNLYKSTVKFEFLPLTIHTLNEQFIHQAPALHVVIYWIDKKNQTAVKFSEKRTSLEK